jgi:hypothetical protein
MQCKKRVRRSPLVRKVDGPSVIVLRWTLYGTPVGSLENAVLCCALFIKPYDSNDEEVLLRVCVDMGMLLHSNEHLQISTVDDRLSMFARFFFINIFSELV